MSKQKNTLRSAIRFTWCFIFVACVIIFYKTIDNLPVILSAIVDFLSVFTPLLGALILFFFIRKPTAYVEKFLKTLKIGKGYPFRRAARGLSVAIVYLLLLGFVVLILYALLPVLIVGVKDLISQLPQYFIEIKDLAGNIANGDSLISSLSLWTWISELSVEDLLSKLPSFDVSSVSKYLNSVMNVSGVLLNIFISIILSIYICLQRDSLRKLVSRVSHAFMSDSTIAHINITLKKIDYIIIRYFFGQFCDSLLVSIFAAITLEILGIPYGIVLGFLFGMFNLIPYFGPIFIFFLVILVTFLSSGWWITLWAAIILLVIQQIDANIINPKILGTSLDISPLWVLLAVTFGGDLFGLTGMFLSVPVFAVLRLFCLELLALREKKIKERTDYIDNPFVIDETAESPVTENEEDDDSLQPASEVPSWLNKTVHKIANSVVHVSKKTKKKKK